jgi:hypothetical protein
MKTLKSKGVAYVKAVDIILYDDGKKKGCKETESSICNNKKDMFSIRKQRNQTLKLYQPKASINVERVKKFKLPYLLKNTYDTSNTSNIQTKVGTIDDNDYVCNFTEESSINTSSGRLGLNRNCNRIITITGDGSELNFDPVENIINPTVGKKVLKKQFNYELPMNKNQFAINLDKLVALQNKFTTVKNIPLVKNLKLDLHGSRGENLIDNNLIHAHKNENNYDHRYYLTTTKAALPNICVEQCYIKNIKSLYSRLNVFKSSLNNAKEKEKIKIKKEIKLTKIK